MKQILLFAWIFFAVYPADAQVGTGTIVVFELTSDKFIVAADSRAYSTTDLQKTITARSPHLSPTALSLLSPMLQDT